MHPGQKLQTLKVTLKVFSAICSTFPFGSGFTTSIFQGIFSPIIIRRINI
jgi:predicted membrane protein